MIERHLPGSITVDCCWHDGRIYVVRHSPPRMVVESFAPDLSDQREHLGMPMGANAGARICSWAGVLWLAYRDEGDFGHLLRMDLAEVYDLGLVGGQRPFAFGDSFAAWVVPDNPMRSAKVLPLGQAPETATVQGFSDNIPTGLSHVESGFAVSWDSQRQLQPWGINYVRSGPYLLAQGKHDDGLIGTIDGQQGHLLLWRDGLLNDQRCSANGDSCAVIAWQPGRPARLGVVSAADLVQAVPEPPVEPIPDVNRALWLGAFDRDHDGTFPSNCRFRRGGSVSVVETLAGVGLAYYVNGDPDGDPDAIERAVQARKDQIAAGELPSLPVLAYVPHGVRLPANADWIGAEHYQKTWETLPQFEDRRRAVIREAARPVVVIGQCYTSNANNTKHLKPLVPVFGRILRDEPNAVGFLAFSAGSWRATGFDDPANASVRPLYQELSQSIQTPANGGGGGGEPVPDPEFRIDIFDDYPSRWSRQNPRGFNLEFNITSPHPVLAISLSMEGSGEKPFVPRFDPPSAPDDKEGRYARTLGWKPVINGTWWPLVKAWDDQGNQVNQRGPHQVTVTDEPINGGGGPVDPPPGTPYTPIVFAFDIEGEINAVAAAHPVEWGEAYEYDGHPRTDRFVRLLATHLNLIDARIGLNGKRGTDEPSKDALAIRNSTVPAICGGVEIRDFIFDNGDPDHSPVHQVQWSDATILPGSTHNGQTFPDGVPGKWIQP